MEWGTHELQTLTELGGAMWSDPQISRLRTVETVTAVSSLPLTDERRLERAAAALLERARIEGSAANAWTHGARLQEPFFRLSPDDRLLLVALHRGQWSYGRLGRVLGLSPADLEAEAWSARVRFLAQLRTSGRTRHASYPLGGRAAGANCPEFDLRRPWTQRFLDDELSSGTDRLFLQNHLMACDSCREQLNHARELYFAVDAAVKHAMALSPSLRDGADRAVLAATLAAAHRQHPVTALEVVASLLGRWDIRLAVVFLLASLGAIALKLAP